jgi:undecaprenyl-diphosphatase
VTYLQAILLGLLQGFTEILPISSSGHLVLAKALLNGGPAGELSFRMFAHLGTLLSVIIVFRDDIIRIILALAEGLRHPRRIAAHFRASSPFRLAVFIILGCIPIGIAGVLFDETLSPAFSDPKMVSDFLLVTGLILFLTRYAKPVKGRHLNVVSCLLTGLVQTLAILPGVSRSGSSISAGLIAGLSPREAARFSFLMSLPVVLGAMFVRRAKIVPDGFAAGHIGVLITGAVVACVSGYAALRLLLALLQKGKFHYFSLYCFAVGIAGILFIE